MSQRIVEGLQQAILEHRLAPGIKLSEDEVGKVYGVSRTIVRAALQSLAHAQLVTIEKHRGAFVSRPSVREAHEVFEARAVIEPRIAGMATALMNDAYVGKLNDHIAAEHAALAEGDTGKALALSGQFHIEIALIAKHDVFTQFLQGLVKRSSLIIALYWGRADATCETHSHQALMRAFETGDAKEAEDIMRSHIVDLHSGLDLVKKPKVQTSLADALSS